MERMKQADARKAGLTEFIGTRACKGCGGYHRWFPDKTVAASCSVCEPMTAGLSIGKIKSDLVKDDRRVAKALKDNWKIPTVWRQNIR